MPAAAGLALGLGVEHPAHGSGRGLANVHGSSELPTSFVALMPCTCRRWDRVTAKLISAIENSALLDDAELDELADSFLSHEHAISYPLAGASPQWAASEHTLAEHGPSFEPPPHRWTARRALRSDPTRLEDLLRAADLFEPRHRDAIIHGLLDAANVLKRDRTRRLIRRGLRTAQASVRRTALDRMCEIDGPENARRRAQTDPNAAVRKWQPRTSGLDRTPTLLAT